MLKKLLRDNKGASMILFAFILVALLGIAAVVVDTGMVVVERQRLQKAVDAAALAAAQQLPNTSKAISAANRYVELNGLSPSDISVSFEDSNKIVKVAGKKSISYTFARILGQNGTTTNTSAKAKMGSFGSVFNYAVFSGSTTATLDFNGGGYSITGSVHTNNDFTTNGSGTTITGAVEAMGSVTVHGSSDIANQIPNASYVAMPDFSETIKQQAQEAGQYYEGDMTFNSSSINVTKPIYVHGNITVNGSGFKGVGFLFATGNITFNGSSVNMSGSDGVVIYTGNGNITINGANAIVDGIIYAPGGTITMHGSGQTVNGRVIADTVNFSGSGYTITSSVDDAIKVLPVGYVKLIA